MKLWVANPSILLSSGSLRNVSQHQDTRGQAVAPQLLAWFGATQFLVFGVCGGRVGICVVTLASLPFSPWELSVSLKWKWGGVFQRVLGGGKPPWKNRRMPPFIRAASKEDHLPSGRELSMVTQERVGKRLDTGLTLCFWISLGGGGGQ